MKKNETRLSRWSRLKHSGHTETEVQDKPVTGELGKNKSPVITRVMTMGGSVPVMAPLAGFDETSDDVMTAPPPGAVDLFTPHEDAETLNEDPDSTETERPLSDEEQALVDALPALESLDKTSDFTPFMNDKIPAFIRRKALNVLWRSDAVLANLDGLNDYDEDFTIIETIVNAASDMGGQVSSDSQNTVDNDDDNDKTASSDTHTNDLKNDQSKNINQDHPGGGDKTDQIQPDDTQQSTDNLEEANETAISSPIKS